MRLKVGIAKRGNRTGIAALGLVVILLGSAAGAARAELEILEVPESSALPDELGIPDELKPEVPPFENAPPIPDPPIHDPGLLPADGASVDYRCGSSLGSGPILGPAVAGSCTFTTLVTASGNQIVGTILIGSTSASTIVVGASYVDFNIGARATFAAGSLLKIVVTLTGGSGSGSASVTYQTVSGGTRVNSLLFSHGPNIVTNSDNVFVQADLSSASAGPIVLSGSVSGVSSGVKRITATLPSGLSLVNGKFKTNTFSFTGIPTSLTIEYDDTSSTSKRFTLSHNSNTFSGTFDMVNNGKVTFTNAPKSYEVRWTTDTSNRLQTFTASASNAPSGGSDAKYESAAAGIGGFAIFVDIRKLTSAIVSVDIPNKFYSLSLGFASGGSLNVNIEGAVGTELFDVEVSAGGLTTLTGSVDVDGSTACACNFQLLFDHDSANLVIKADVGSFGDALVVNAPRHVEVKMRREGRVSTAALETVTASASNVPSNSQLRYDAVIAGITVHIDIQRFSSISLSVNMPAKTYDATIAFSSGTGFVDIDVTGTWKSLAYDVRADGSNLRNLFIRIKGSTTFLELRALESAFGFIRVNVNLNFFGFNYANQVAIERPGTSLSYHVIMPLLADQWITEGQCITVSVPLVGTVARFCATA